MYTVHCVLYTVYCILTPFCAAYCILCIALCVLAVGRLKGACNGIVHDIANSSKTATLGLLVGSDFSADAVQKPRRATLNP